MRISDWSSDVCSSDLLMCEANGLDAGDTPHLRDAMVDLIKIVEGFFACGVASSVYGQADPSGNFMPEPVFSNEIGRASCRERVCQYVSISVVAVSLKRKQVSESVNNKEITKHL